ncbi:MAG: histidine phosphatase family protein [Pseudoflavonifractor sp.]
MELILIRHGITPGNLERRFVGRIDQPLAPEGQALARSVASALPQVEHVYRSPMLRCRQTADLLWQGVPQTVIENLHETDFGIYEGKCHAELQDDPVYRRWLAGELTVGEPIENCNARAASALAELAADAAERGWRRAGVVAHGGIFMSMLARFGLPKRDYYDWLLPNCGGFRAQLDPATLTLRITGRAGAEEGGAPVPKPTEV